MKLNHQTLASVVLVSMLGFVQWRDYSPQSDGVLYVLGVGETVPQVAARFAIPVHDLYRSNGIINPLKAIAGTRLYLGTPPKTSKEVMHFAPGSATSPVDKAILGGLSISAVVELNGGNSPIDLIAEAIYLPNMQSELPEVAEVRPTQIPLPPTQTLSGNATAVPGPPLRRSQLGIQAFFGGDFSRTNYWLDKASEAGFTWVKYQAEWNKLEYPPDIYPELGTLDGFMDQAQSKGFNVLLSLVKAPDWARSSFDGDGPPALYRDYFEFAQFLANRYKARLDHMQIAFEIWNEPNTRREWEGAALSASDYVTLLSGSYVAIKGEDSRYIVVSAGLAPNGVYDGVNAIDDRVYLRQMYQAGLANVIDALGIHPYGWANPPGLRCCGSNDGPGVFDDSSHFFFLDTIEEYRQIMVEAGDANAHDMWVTEFGWGSMEGLGRPVPADSQQFAYVTQQQQAEYIWRAYQMVNDWDFMGPMFLWNLNFASVPETNPDFMGYSIFSDEHTPRPAYWLLMNAPKTDN
jgi:hypothetical protein